MANSRSRIIFWSVLSGLLWMLAWPGIGGWVPIAFIAWLPLLHAERTHLQRPSGVRGSFIPYVMLALLVWNAGCSWWFFMVNEPMSTRIASVSVPVLVNTLLMSLPWWLRGVSRRILGQRASAIGFVLFWIAYERMHHNWDMQWPWFSIGNVFGTFPSWVQWYEYTGIMGGGLWVLVANLVLHQVIIAKTHDRLSTGARKPLLAAVALIVVPVAISQVIWHGHVDEGRAVEVAVVQPNMDPYSEKFGGVDALEQLDRMLDLARSVMTERTRLVVFPETALQESTYLTGDATGPEMVGLWENDLENSRSVARMREFERHYPETGLLSGMSSNYLFLPGEPLSVTARPLGEGRLHYDAANAAVFLPTEGPLQQYRKSRLVAGVELMPFEEHLGMLGNLAIDLGGTTGSLAQQAERSVLVDDRTGIRIVPAICYESVFGEHIAAHVRNGGNLIAIMTNDGWWDDSPGFQQHLAFAPLRAIETRRSVARSANTGISCFVDQRGEIHYRTRWWTRDAKVASVHLNERITFFVEHGDLIGRVAEWLSSALLLVLLFRMIQLRIGKTS